MQLNADIVPIKSLYSLYFESSSKRFELGQKYSCLYGKFTVEKLSYYIPSSYYSTKTANTDLFDNDLLDH